MATDWDSLAANASAEIKEDEIDNLADEELEQLLNDTLLVTTIIIMRVVWGFVQRKTSCMSKKASAICATHQT